MAKNGSDSFPLFNNDRVWLTYVEAREAFQGFSESDLDDILTVNSGIDPRLELVKKALDAGFDKVELSVQGRQPAMDQRLLKNLYTGVLGLLQKDQGGHKGRLIVLTPNSKGLQEFQDAAKGRLTLDDVTVGAFYSAVDGFDARNHGKPTDNVLHNYENGVFDTAPHQRHYISACFGHREFEEITLDVPGSETGSKQETVLRSSSYPSIQRLVERIRYAFEHGADEVSIADSQGLASADETFRVFCYLMSDYILTPRQRSGLIYHCHNSNEAQGLRNIKAAYAAGIRRFDVGGKGGCSSLPEDQRTGNISAIKVAHMFQNEGINTGIDLHKLRELTDYVQTKVYHPENTSVSSYSAEPSASVSFAK